MGELTPPEFENPKEVKKTAIKILVWLAERKMGDIAYEFSNLVIKLAHDYDIEAMKNKLRESLIKAREILMSDSDTLELIRELTDKHHLTFTYEASIKLLTEKVERALKELEMVKIPEEVLILAENIRFSAIRELSYLAGIKAAISFFDD